MQDKDFINQFVTVLSILIGIAVIILIVARGLSDIHQEPDQAMTDTINMRIKPVGDVHIGTAPGVVAVQQTPSRATKIAADAPQDPAQIYQSACASCHAAGIANAPIYGDQAAWATRLADVQTLYASSLNGKGAMPAKGGRPDLSDDTIKAVVDYMLDAVR